MNAPHFCATWDCGDAATLILFMVTDKITFASLITVISIHVYIIH